MIKSILTVPNLMTLIRFLFIWPLLYFLLNGNFIWALSITALFYFIDYMDGIVARLLDQCTDFGRNFDAAADISFAAVLIVWAMIYSSIPSLIWIAFVINILIMATIILMFLKKLKIWPKLSGKKYNSLVFIMFQMLMIMDFKDPMIGYGYWAIVAFFVYRNIDIYLQFKKLDIKAQK